MKLSGSHAPAWESISAYFTQLLYAFPCSAWEQDKNLLGFITTIQPNLPNELNMILLFILATLHYLPVHLPECFQSVQCRTIFHLQKG